MFATHYHALNHEARLHGVVALAHMVTAVSASGSIVPLHQLGSRGITPGAHLLGGVSCMLHAWRIMLCCLHLLAY